LLLDTPDELVHGGSGRTFDWSLAPQQGRGRIILAGGLNAGNVAEAIRLVQPYAVDVSSGVERSPGIKDHKKIQAFVSAVKSSPQNR
ncbi:MAG: N-(5'-phosphoribosyl)anthranilate isomerase, partial [Gammaproteobacteria bacterium]